MKARVAIIYPVEHGRIVLRTEADWDRDLEAVEVSPDRTRHVFEIKSEEEMAEFKSCLRMGDARHWAVGVNCHGRTATRRFLPNLVYSHEWLNAMQSFCLLIP